MNKINVLFECWVNIPHSYSIVNCFQLIHLVKNYSDKVNIFTKELDYLGAWKAKPLVYSEEYNNIIKNLKVYTGIEHIDLVYSIVYPYNISVSLPGVPKLVFFTSEFSTLDTSYFNPQFKNDAELIDYLDSNKNISFISPSKWSDNGIKKYNVNSSIITHGVDTSIFYKHKSNDIRNKIRNFYKIKETDILMLNIGGMSGNKGISLILEALNILVNKLGYTHYKLMLKGTADLYCSKNLLEMYLKNLTENNTMSATELDVLVENHIIFTDKTLPYKEINNIFNSCDIYISPYLCEGFGMVMLESVSSGLHTIVPKTGSTSDYIPGILENGGDSFISYVESSVILHETRYCNDIRINDLLNTILQNESKFKHFDNIKYDLMHNYIEEKLSWNHVSDLLYKTFKKVFDQKNYN
jgi:glycosyltransferase involved in cell wall biosynthesis